MIPVITTIIYMVVSLVIVIFMSIESNKKIKCDYTDDERSNQNIELYGASKKNYISLFFIGGISAVCGYVTAVNAISWLAILELGMCYMATLAAAVIDLKTKTIPNYISLTIVGVRIVIFIYEVYYMHISIGYLISSLMGCFLCAMILIIANRISKGGIGVGDIKILSSIGFVCGIYVVFSVLLLALVICIIISIMLFILKKRKITDDLPFGPFIYMGMIVMSLLTLY